MTNFERIKAMGVEEMTEFLDKLARDDCGLPTSCLDLDCKKCVKKFLESEVQENDT